MFGPVTSQMRPAAPCLAARGRREIAIVGDERPAIGRSACSTTGWRPPSMAKIERAVDLRTHVIALDREHRERRGDVEHGKRLGRALDRRRCRPPPTRRAARRSQARAPSARSAALAIFASSSPSSVVVKRTWPASVWRWMKRRVERRGEQFLAMLRGDLDEIAEHVVVPDFQRANAGRLRRSAPAARR